MELALQAALIGLIQGLTEFIPISSSAHLALAPWLFGWEDSSCWSAASNSTCSCTLGR